MLHPRTVGAHSFIVGVYQSARPRQGVRCALRSVAPRSGPFPWASDLDRACARAAHFGNYTLDALRVILERRLFELPLDELSLTPAQPLPQIAIVRPLEAYA
jgi:hypothetical protein